MHDPLHAPLPPLRERLLRAEPGEGHAPGRLPAGLGHDSGGPPAAGFLRGPDRRGAAAAAGHRRGRAGDPPPGLRLGHGHQRLVLRRGDAREADGRRDGRRHREPGRPGGLPRLDARGSRELSAGAARHRHHRRGAAPERRCRHLREPAEPLGTPGNLRNPQRPRREAMAAVHDYSHRPGCRRSGDETC